jgi:S-adenosylmethionine/arginine decarboxylase-like enzyme
MSFKEMLLKEQDVVIGKVPASGEDDYGMELILDIHDCDISKSNRKDIESFLEQLCKLIDIKRIELHWWDYAGNEEGYKRDWTDKPYLVGTSCVQFIHTSSIVIHTIDPWKKVFMNIFSCKTFDPDVAQKFAAEFFKGTVVTNQVIVRR